MRNVITLRCNVMRFRYCVNMGRRRIHDEATADALLDAAEAILEAEGLEALTVRRVADEVGTTTRAVYSSLGSKDALLTGLGMRAFDLLGTPRRIWSRPGHRGSVSGRWLIPRSFRLPSSSRPRFPGMSGCASGPRQSVHWKRSTS